MANTLIGAINDMSEEIGVRVEDVARSIQGLWTVPRAATSDTREHAFIRYTVGTGEWDSQRKYNVLRMKMFKMSGEPDGFHDGVWEPQVPDGADQDDIITLLKTPGETPRPPFDEPKGPVPVQAPRAYTKAIWSFGDGTDTIIATGPAELHLVEMTDHSHIFLVSVAGIMSSGTGKYEGGRGIKTALGSTFVPAGADLFNPPGGKFGAVTVETFRVILASDIA